MNTKIHHKSAVPTLTSKCSPNTVTVHHTLLTLPYVLHKALPCVQPTSTAMKSGYWLLTFCYTLFSDAVSSWRYVASTIDERMNKHGALVEYYWPGKPEVFEEKPISVPPQIPHWMNCDSTRACAVRNWWLTELWHCRSTFLNVQFLPVCPS